METERITYDSYRADGEGLAADFYDDLYDSRLYTDDKQPQHSGVCYHVNFYSVTNSFVVSFSYSQFCQAMIHK